MTHRTDPWPHGMPVWATLATGDEPRAREFYARVLGWEFADAGPRQHHWTMATADGRVVAGIGEVRSSGSSAWVLHFAVDDLDRCAADIVNAGGQLLLPAHEVLAGAARSVIGRDAGGVRFGLLQAGEFVGPDVVAVPGGLVWEDGVADDPDAARRFYADLLGWTYGEVTPAGGAYATFGPGPDVTWGGLGGNPTDSPAYWCVWFGVDSLDGAVDAVVDLGGSVLDGPLDAPLGDLGPTRLARVRDPEGAVFGLVAPDWDRVRHRG